MPPHPADTLSASLTRRERMSLPNGETTVYRVADGSGDGLPGIFIDSCDGHWLVQTQDIPWPAWLEETQRRAGGVRCGGSVSTSRRRKRRAAWRVKDRRGRLRHGNWG